MLSTREYKLNDPIVMPAGVRSHRMGFPFIAMINNQPFGIESMSCGGRRLLVHELSGIVGKGQDITLKTRPFSDPEQQVLAASYFEGVDTHADEVVLVENRHGGKCHSFDGYAPATTGAEVTLKKVALAA